jgi:RNA polymerase sigma-70 factor (ECF subfamily)
MSIFNDDREQKFISVYRAYIDEIYQYVYLRTGLNHALAEDISQEIFLDVYKGLSGFKGLCSERTWVYKIAKNKLNDFYRRQYSQKIELIEIDSQFAEELDDPSQNIQEAVIKTFEREKVRDCLNGLLEQYKLVLFLKYMDEKSVKDIAHIVGKSPKAVESILQRAKTAFIKSYSQYEEKEEL